MTPAERHLPNSVPVIIRGTLYPSMSAAARALGVSHQAVCCAADNGTLDGVGLRKARIAEIRRGA